MTPPTLYWPLVRLAEQHRFEALKRVAQDAVEVSQKEGTHAANRFILEQIGVAIGPLLNEDYARQMLSYNLALIHAASGNHRKAANYIWDSGVMPGTGGDQIFSDHLAESFRIHHHQKSAFERGIPAIMLSAMPRSGSAFFSQTMAVLLDAPIVRISLGHFPDFGLVPCWLNKFSPGGGVLHDHFCASEYNLDVLRTAGVQDVFVLVRDPRPAALSYAEHLLGGGLASGELQDIVKAAYLTRFAPWLKAWVAAEANEQDWLKIHWILSSQVRSDVKEALKLIFDPLRPLYPALPEADGVVVPEVEANKHFGDDDRWRHLLPAMLHDVMWDQLDAIADRFGFGRA